MRAGSSSRFGRCGQRRTGRHPDEGHGQPEPRGADGGRHAEAGRREGQHAHGHGPAEIAEDHGLPPGESGTEIRVEDEEQHGRRNRRPVPPPPRGHRRPAPCSSVMTSSTGPATIGKLPSQPATFGPHRRATSVTVARSDGTSSSLTKRISNGGGFSVTPGPGHAGGPQADDGHRRHRRPASPGPCPSARPRRPPGCQVGLPEFPAEQQRAPHSISS